MCSPVVCKEDSIPEHSFHPVLGDRRRGRVEVETTDQDPIIIRLTLPCILLDSYAQATQNTS